MFKSKFASLERIATYVYIPIFNSLLLTPVILLVLIFLKLGWYNYSWLLMQIASRCYILYVLSMYMTIIRLTLFRSYRKTTCCWIIIWGPTIRAQRQGKTTSIVVSKQNDLVYSISLPLLIQVKFFYTGSLKYICFNKMCFLSISF